MPKVRDVTDELVRDSSSGPGEYAARVARAKPAKDLTPTLIETLAQWERKSDRTMGHISKALAYSRGMPHSKSEHSNTIRLIKAGHLRVCQVDTAPPDGSQAKRDSPYGQKYYIIKLGHCGDDVADGALSGRKRRR